MFGDTKRRPRVRRGLRTLAIATWVLLAFPILAQAATVSVTGTTMTFTAAVGETNGLAVSVAGNVYTFSDFPSTVSAGPGCAPAGVNAATCTVVGATLITINLGDADDSSSSATVPVNTVVNGGSGRDSISTGAGNDVLNGEDDSDSFSDGGGNDVVNGGPDGDNYQAGAGADVYNGGPESDTVDYRLRSGGVNVSLDGVGNDGDPGEGDNIQTDVENVATGNGNDVVSGNDGTNSLQTANGNDTINGLDGDDFLGGGAGDDILNGGNGGDSVRGNSGNDIVNGDAGDDSLGSDTGNDVISGGPGNDAVSYSGRGTTPVTVTLDDVANDGMAPEVDNVKSDIENVTGGEGNDVLTGNGKVNSLTGLGGDDVLNGAGGPDNLSGGTGRNTLNGGAGDDFFSAGYEADVFAGGSGQDFVSYSGRIDPVIVTINGVANDGEAGEGDNVRVDVEDVSGGAGNDRLTGNGLANELFGGYGNDIISGGSGSDLVSGGNGADRLTGGSGADHFDGGGGRDTVVARDGRADDIFCGSGVDRILTADRGRDRISPDCG